MACSSESPYNFWLIQDRRCPVGFHLLRALQEYVEVVVQPIPKASLVDGIDSNALRESSIWKKYGRERLLYRRGATDATVLTAVGPCSKEANRKLTSFSHIINNITSLRFDSESERGFREMPSCHIICPGYIYNRSTTWQQRVLAASYC